MINGQIASEGFSFGGFVWWVGVVEDRKNDPLKLGRVKVRILGYHTPVKSDIDTTHLPWAVVSMPVTSAAVSGVGASPSGLVEGSHVWGFFRDGHDATDPVVCGVFPGIPVESANTHSGFNDPNGVYPKADLIGESDVNRLARGNTENTAVSRQNENRTTGVSTSGGASWDEPESAYAAQYPNNHVTETESGHVIQMDDTTDNERISVHHKSGTYTETRPDGTQVTKVVGDNYQLTAGSNFVHIAGVCNITISGNANVLVEGNSQMVTKGNHTHSVEGNMTTEVGGNCTIESAGRMVIKGARIDLN